MIDEANALTDPEARAALYNQIGELHYALAPLIVIPEQAPFLTVREELEGAYYNPMLSSGMPYLLKDITK